ncbi:hypothetical protein [Brevundimonas sp.]|uniref:hypothetical protein n=1 Tax=Brevundimonas sp. TaxID=1871086 RepID=UPI003BAD84E5
MIRWALTILLVLSAPTAVYAAYAAIYSAIQLSKDLLGLMTTLLWLSCAYFIVGLWRQKTTNKSLTSIISYIAVGGILLALCVNAVFLITILVTWDPDVIGQYP